MKDGNNIAQTKDDFAENILQQSEEYKDVDFNGFRSVFEIIEDILKLVKA